MKTKTFWPILLLLAVFAQTGHAQKEWAVYDESRIAPYELPALLTMENGKKVTTTHEWEARRRDLIALFSEHIYGQSPKDKVKVVYKTVEQSDEALGGKAIRKQVVATFTANGQSAEMNLLLYLPKSVDKPVPLFFGLNFYGNQTVLNDPAILTNNAFALNVEEKGIFHNQSSEAIRGIQSHRWCVERIIDEGYGLATVYYGEIYPDREGGKNEGIAALLHKEKGAKAASQWEAIGAWAWGISRAMDYLQTDRDIDAKQVILMGHSRLGKAAFWAGAQDKRFAIVISNDSGCGGAAIFRRKIGETAAIINAYFPYWFCANFKQYNDKEERLPVDQHELVALIAPRPVYIASAEEDVWADPKGEYLAAYHAGEVYKLYGFARLESVEMPSVNTPVGNRVGYHIRTGGHDVTPYDWACYLRFANRFISRER